jgi:hypothetical protein
MTSFKLPHINLPTVDLPNINLPKVDLPKIDLPKIDLSRIDTGKLAAVAQDAFYVTVGLGVLTFQRAQVRRQELSKRFATAESPLSTLEARLAKLEATVDHFAEQLKTRLPEPAEKLFGIAYDAAKNTRQQVRQLIVNAA